MGLRHVLALGAAAYGGFDRIGPGTKRSMR
jgi:hypothetical protein